MWREGFIGQNLIYMGVAHHFCSAKYIIPQLEVNLINEGDVRPWQYSLDCCLRLRVMLGHGNTVWTAA